MLALNIVKVSAGRPLAGKGLNMLRPIDIPPGRVLYRFYDSHRAATPLQGADGPWWMAHGDFEALRHYASGSQRSMSDVACAYAAFMLEWEGVDSVVVCRTVMPLRAWGGHARTVPASRLQVPACELNLMCIPGLGGRGSIMSAALQIRSHDVL